MELSLAQRILAQKKPFVLYHTHSVTEKTVKQAIKENKSMDLDISIDNKGVPYLGHTKEYYQISGEIQPNSMSFNKAIDLIAKANIPVMVDCKHHHAWPIIKDIIKKIGAHRCLVHSFVSELKFTHHLSYDYDYPSEWSPASKLDLLKDQFPNITTTASCKFLPVNLLTSNQHFGLLEKIQEVLVKNHIDTVCLNVPDKTMSDKILDLFLSKNITPHVGVDNINPSTLSSIYIGETNILKNASNCKTLSY